MQNIRKLRSLLDELSDENNYLFTVQDFSPAFPDLSYNALKALISRSAKQSVLRRVCTGLYVNPRIPFPRDLLLYHAAGKLRSSFFHYLSLETVLSEAGVISQIPIQWITLMSSGRSYTFDCGSFGTIEFIHTKRRPADVMNGLTYDHRYFLWRANVNLALQDMRYTGRPLDLVDWSVVHELV